jgi:hypothetical protein
MFREHDPVYSESNYEDDPSIKGGYIFLFVILGLLALYSIFYVVETQREKKQAERYREIFARRVASTIHFTGSRDKLTPEALGAEFKRMDKNNDGVLSKKEVREFLGDKMDNRDFEAMFAAIDVDQNDTVCFSEFCGFMVMIGQTHHEEAKVLGTTEKGSEEEAVINC